MTDNEDINDKTQALPRQVPWGKEIAAQLNTEIIGRPLVSYDKVSSTNDVLKGLAMDGAPEGLTVVADTQTQGRGRQGRSWESKQGMGVYMSVLTRPKWPTKDAGWLAVFVSVATANALEGLGVKDVGIKWPNDILAGGKKVGGVLIEPRMGKEGIEFAVLGVGINVRQHEEDFEDDIRDTATSCLLQGFDIDCRVVTVALLMEMDRWYTRIDGAARLEMLQMWIDKGGSDQIPVLQEVL